MPVCRHCDQFYQAGSDHDTACMAPRPEIPEWKGEMTKVCPEPPRRTPGICSKLYGLVRSHLRERLKRYRAKRRLPVVCKKWNREIDAKFAEDVAEQEADPDFGLDPHIAFKWNQLVWQEILMWNSLGELVTESEFHSLCNLRGFSLAQRRYLREMLEFMDLKGWEDE